MHGFSIVPGIFMGENIWIFHRECRRLIVGLVEVENELGANN
jgi:hypothetical protein